jgi:acyl phosphate:glycerol-3-phosphate acyltransferase
MENTANILPITRAVLAIAFSYLIGSIPMGLIVARVAGGIDIREHGSGNIGLTNVIRTLGWGPGLITGVLDFLKGYLPVYFVLKTFTPNDFGGVFAIYEIIVILVALLLLLGNLYPVYLMFRGGKGVATGLGVMSALLGPFIFIPLAIFAVALLLSRYVSLGSICAAVALPLTVLLLKSKIPFASESPSGFVILIIFSTAVALLVIWKHRPNISRVFAGTEPKVGKTKLPERLMRKFSEPKPEVKSGNEALQDLSSDKNSENKV